MSKFKLNIDEPCSQKWENFTPMGKNRYCGQCEKEVIDFTKYSDMEIREYFKSRSKNICGMLREDQLRVYSNRNANRKLSRWLAWPIAAIATLYSSSYVVAQERKEKIENTIQPKEIEPPVFPRVISGVVTDEDGSKLEGVTVWGKTGFTKTDSDGTYSIVVNSRFERLTFEFERKSNQSVIVDRKSAINPILKDGLPPMISNDCNNVLGGIGATSVIIIKAPDQTSKMLKKWIFRN